MVKGRDTQLLISVFLDDAQSVVMGVKRSHEDERDIDFVRRVQMLNLSHGEVEERHIVLDFERAFRASHAFTAVVNL